ncbi:hypothetical protein V7S43_010361 [Phytophthora oleae]|uniref:Uncharacterized protein n=1 Tax=Phytophthora oleae TaxID=2107226 RepID=A0ABD3FFC9_9STRA
MVKQFETDVKDQPELVADEAKVLTTYVRNTKTTLKKADSRWKKQAELEEREYSMSKAAMMDKRNAFADFKESKSLEEVLAKHAERYVEKDTKRKKDTELVAALDPDSLSDEE